MLQKIVLQCKYDGDQRANYNWGSLLHGVLMEKLPVDIVSILHQSKLHPFSQYCIQNSDQNLTWTIGLWDSEIAGHILQAIESLKEIWLEQKKLGLRVTGIQKECKSEDEHFSFFFNSDVPCRRYDLEFLTPCAHKQEGEYIIFPTPGLIVNSLFKKYNAYARDISLDDSEAREQITAHMKIVRYSLNSAVYYLEKTKITGYRGRITLVINGPEQLVRLAGALLCFSEYSGVGIKTALGMGAVRVKSMHAPQGDKPSK